ncbi:hypothetical protein LTR17_000664 [Elasticomyces elasticus]|nr:hypothetical protein LTR17_000664 [Elasticomyces elasticus]
MAGIKRTSSNVLSNLDLGRRRLTRLQEQQIRAVFRFLELPAELRCIIYDYCVDVSAAQNILARYYDNLKDCTDLKAVQAPLIYSKSPAIFLLNRQVYNEAKFYLPKRGITLDHGLLDLMDVSDFIRPSLFRSVSSLTIDDSGHPLFKKNIMAASWVGYTSLIEQVAQILGEGHQLKSFTISLSSKDLVPHVTTCWNNSNMQCGFRDHLRRACDALRSVRNIGCVTLRGLPEPLSSELKARMESAPINFLDLPAELRNTIYNYCLDGSKQDAHSISASPLQNFARTVSAVLLLNRQITREAQSVLRKKPLTIDYPKDHEMESKDDTPELLNTITQATLANRKHLVGA